ncbi:hypothetical protein WJX74_004779 [Apatococcus lobatus]|uniref:Uncharacterized protein n=1 Tax=Apatococcus lobatus TaxID=904363 RepID=A0AAW1S219_9CHLO
MATPKPERGLLQELTLHCRLWLSGVKEGFCLHRCVIYWVHDPTIWWKTVRCFTFNGVIFGGSIVIFKALLAPGFRWLVGTAVPAWASALDASLYLVYTFTWLFPVYIISFIVNCLWYQEIAERAFRVGQQRAVQSGQQAKARVLAGKPMPFPHMLAQELFRMTLFCVFFIQSLVAGCIPFIGPLANFVLLSWLYAFYFFDYKWAMTNVPLVTRVQHFEGHFAFFAGFGSVCTLATLIWPFFEGVAVMGVIFPLFVMVACEADPRLALQQCESKLLDIGPTAGSQLSGNAECSFAQAAPLSASHLCY